MIWFQEEDDSKVQDTTLNVDDFISDEMEYEIIDQNTQMFSRSLPENVS